MRYIAIAPRGLEDVACREMADTVPAATILERGRGVILLTVGSGRGDPRPLLDLHGIDDLLAEVAVLHDLDPRHDAPGLLAAAIRRSEEVEEALTARWAFRSAQRALTPTVTWANLARWATPWSARGSQTEPRVGNAVRSAVPRKPTFRVTGHVEGRQPFRRVDVQSAVQKSLSARFPGWVHLPEGATPDLEFAVWISASTARVGLRLVEPGFSHRLWKVGHIPASLPPSIAYGLVCTAGTHAGEVVLDPFCGAGTILIERALATPAPGQLLGSDLSATARAAAAANAATVRVDLSLHDWDATALPLDAASVDTTITNPPYGERHGQLADLPGLYSGFLAEALRVLRPGGRCVVLTTQAAMMDRLLDGRPELVRCTRFGVDVLGLAAHVHVLEHI